MLAMAFDMCADTESCDYSGITEFSKETEQQPESGNLCSPFCHCLRCPSILLPAILSGFPDAGFLKEKFNFQSESVMLNVRKAVWQPPKAA